VIGVVGVLAGIGIAFFLSESRAKQLASTQAAEEVARRWKQEEDSRNQARARNDEQVAAIRREAEEQAKALVRDAKDEIAQRRKEADNEIRRREKDIERREQNFLKTEEKLTESLDKVDKRRAELDRRNSNLDKREQQIDQLEQQRQQKLEELDGQIQAELTRVANLDEDAARAEVLARVEDRARYDAAQLRKGIEDQARAEATDTARKLIVKAVFRCAVDHYADSLITSVEIKNDDMKGRIIGREGRNIRAIEAATGVDVIIDDTPNVVLLSSFDGVRREVARQSLERLLQDGRIHPGKIEEIVAGAEEAVNEEIWRAGQEATFRLGITGLHPELIKLLGKCKFRTSYGQNVLAHSIEVAILSGIIASELGINPKNARRGGLLHDFGKAADAEMEGSHPEVGGKMARKFGENPIVVNCIEGHHGDVEQTLEAAIVQVADAISAVRPGARGEAIQSYLSRLTELEDLATSFAGVEKAYAISAGRELRVMVKPDQMDDVLTYDLCRQITQRIEDELEYPGTIKVTVIRELREVSTAK
jgi:ribonuclease Y